MEIIVAIIVLVVIGLALIFLVLGLVGLLYASWTGIFSMEKYKGMGHTAVYENERPAQRIEETENLIVSSAKAKSKEWKYED